MGAAEVAVRGRPSRETLYRRFEIAIGELRRFGGLPGPSQAQQIWDDIWRLEAHNSTAIEGNTLVLREVEALLSDGRAVGAKVLKDYLEVLGYGDAARWVYAQAVDPKWLETGRLVTVTDIRQVHRDLMTKVWEIAPHPEATAKEAPGAFRQHDLHPFGGGMRPPAWTEVPPLVSDWAARVGEVGLAVASGGLGLQAIPVSLARLHSSFERIHPFIDGNGRTGRLLLNLVLVRLGFPPAIIYKRQRSTYLDALDRADHDDPGALAELIARSVIDNLHRFLVPKIAGPARSVPLASLATSGISYQALRQAARRGRLDASQGSDGLWRSSRKSVDAYLANRFRRSR